MVFAVKNINLNMYLMFIQWNSNHEGLTCEQYTAWLEDNDPERSLTAIQQHLRDNGLECPRCHFKYSLSR